MSDIADINDTFVKVNGKRMCDLVRSGRADEINLKSRPVNIKELKVLSINKNKIMFNCKVIINIV